MLGLFLIGMPLTIIGFYIAYSIGSRKKEMTWNNIKEKLSIWSLYHREYIVGFVIGFILGALVL